MYVSLGLQDFPNYIPSANSTIHLTLCRTETQGVHYIKKQQQPTNSKDEGFILTGGSENE